MHHCMKKCIGWCELNLVVLDSLIIAYIRRSTELDGLHSLTLRYFQRMSATIFCSIFQSSNKVKEIIKGLTSFSIFILQSLT